MSTCTSSFRKYFANSLQKCVRRQHLVAMMIMMNIGTASRSIIHTVTVLTVATDNDEADIRNAPEQSEASNQPLPTTPTRQRNTQRHVAGNADCVELKVPAWMLQFGTLQISLSPNRVSPDEGGSSAHPIQNDPSRNVHTPLPTRRTQPSHRTPHERSQGSPAAIPRSSISQTPERNPVPAINPPTPPRERHRYHQHVHPHPIFPLQPDDEAPSTRTFDQSRAHGYYIIFVGPRLGIFHEYWSATVALACYTLLTLWL